MAYFTIAAGTIALLALPRWLLAAARALCTKRISFDLGTRDSLFFFHKGLTPPTDLPDPLHSSGWDFDSHK